MKVLWTGVKVMMALEVSAWSALTFTSVFPDSRIGVRRRNLSHQTHVLLHLALHYEQTHQRCSHPLHRRSHGCGRRPSPILLFLYSVLLQAHFVPLEQFRSSNVWDLCSYPKSHDFDLCSGSRDLCLRCLVGYFARDLHLAAPARPQDKGSDYNPARTGRTVC